MCQPGNYEKDKSQSLFSWEGYSCINTTLHFEISLCPVQLIYATAHPYAVQIIPVQKDTIGIKKGTEKDNNSYESCCISYKN